MSNKKKYENSDGMCTFCDGTGRTDKTHTSWCREVTCPYCHGKGWGEWAITNGNRERWILEKEKKRQAREKEEAGWPRKWALEDEAAGKCRFCHGSGEYYCDGYYQCSACQGTGDTECYRDWVIPMSDGGGTRWHGCLCPILSVLLPLVLFIILLSIL
jgi:RecJ-like exonuclease